MKVSVWISATNPARVLGVKTMSAVIENISKHSVLNDGHVDDESFIDNLVGPDVEIPILLTIRVAKALGLAEKDI